MISLALLRRAPLGVLVLLGACTVGPDFQRPAAPVVGGFRSAQDDPAVPGAPLAIVATGPAQRWWTAFGSPDLDALVDRAIDHNRLLEASNATLARARSQLRAVRGTAAPQIDATTRIEREQVNLAGFGFDPGAGGNPEFTLYSVGGGVSYDLDLFGGRRRRIERSAAQGEAQLRQTEAAHLALAGQVVGQALAVAAIRAQIAAANALIVEDEKTADLSEKRRVGGEGTLVEVLNARSQLSADKGDLPALAQQLAEARHLLATLVGEAPADVTLPDFDLDRLVLPATIPVALPSELVHRRPDILQAEADLHAATAAIGIATARLYPDITLGATLSQGAPSIADIASNAFRGFDIFAGLTAPIFHGGTLKAERQAAVEQARAAQATYRQTVLDAFRQVADLLAAIDHDQQAVAQQREAVDVAGRSLALSRRSFQVGNSGVLQVLDSDRIYQRALQGLVTARARQFMNVARLHVATAGGWTGPAAQVAATR